LKKRVDVVVMGAGVVGCAVAYYLAKQGCRVIVIEKRERICSGGSGANQGGVPLSLCLPESPVLNLIQESVKLFGTLSQEIDYDIEFEKVGLLTCTTEEAKYPAIKNLAQGLQDKGINVKLLEGDEIRKQEPSISPNVVAGVEDEGTGIVNPFKVTYGFARAARKLGTEFLLSTEAQAIEVDKDKVTAVVTTKERINTDFVVNAAGPWSPEIGKMVSLNIPIQPFKGQVIVTEPVALNQKWRYIMDADYLSHGTPVSDSPDPYLRFGIGPGWIQENTGNWTIGSSHEISFDNRVTLPTIACLAKKAVEFMPKLKHVDFIRIWAGLRPHCYVDDLPILGKVDNPSGFVIATGHSGAGLTLAPITGKLIAELIIEKRTSLSIDAFAFSRFNN
jgi:glycine/D-amino acid oxidase-like deaminating enzyme